jgi:hypothetical protein
VERGKEDAPVKLEVLVEAQTDFGGARDLEVEGQRGVGLLMVEAQSGAGLSLDLEAERAIPGPQQTHPPSVLLLKIAFRSRRSFQTSSMGYSAF